MSIAEEVAVQLGKILPGDARIVAIQANYVRKDGTCGGRLLVFGEADKHDIMVLGAETVKYSGLHLRNLSAMAAQIVSGAQEDGTPDVTPEEAAACFAVLAEKLEPIEGEEAKGVSFVMKRDDPGGE